MIELAKLSPLVVVVARRGPSAARAVRRAVAGAGRSMSVISDPGRDSRLTWSKHAEYEARKELSAIATKKCDAHLAAFSRCAQEQNLMVVFNCREENRKMNACLSQYTNEAAFEEYKLRRSIELAKQGKKGGA